ncbi:type IV pilus modification PilV family protein [Marinomonas polaris]|uniref:type IV pilus modification PilV family protein n=1 Tax=Marinomonas polaris TaxID=293552 RepID=UPI003F9B30FC
MRMNKQRLMQRLSKPRQKGWIMLEVILCLALFAVVLLVLQRQSSAQWQSVQQTEEHRKLHENQQKQAAMAQLTGSLIWLDAQSSPNEGYPDCQKCTGNELKNWFHASQHFLFESTTLTLSEEDTR